MAAIRERTALILALCLSLVKDVGYSVSKRPRLKPSAVRERWVVRSSRCQMPVLVGCIQSGAVPEAYSAAEHRCKHLTYLAIMITDGGFPIPLCSPHYLPRLGKENRLEARATRLWHIVGGLHNFSFAKGNQLRVVCGFQTLSRARYLSVEWL
jgi:hypothetical protein